MSTTEKNNVAAAAWLQELSGAVPALASLIEAPQAEQEKRGYHHTLAEIAQQPSTWIDTGTSLAKRAGDLRGLFTRAADAATGSPGLVLLTGSGSSAYVGDCVAPGLGRAFGVAARAVPAGDLLTHSSSALPATGAAGDVTLMSFARSGNSPESVAAVQRVLALQPRARHVIVTCNRAGRLATAHPDDARFVTVVLDERTNDRSLVMTSSFTNMALAGRLIATARETAPASAASAMIGRATALADAARSLLLSRTGAIADVAAGEHTRAVFLGAGPRYGAAREAALKMLEMTAGGVMTLAETFLGLRHGPMSVIDKRTLLVAFLSRDANARRYEVDLLRELRDKQLGATLLIAGAGAHQVAEETGAAGANPAVVPIDYDPNGPGATPLTDDDLALLDVVVGQWLGFFTCLRCGLRPDAPSNDGVITRVVAPFTIHGA